MAQHPRAFWQRLFAEVSTGTPISVVAARYKVRPRTLEWWCWRLRRDAAGARLVPVVITPPTPPAPTTALELAVADVRLRIEVGTDTRYVAALVAALRAC